MPRTGVLRAAMGSSSDARCRISHVELGGRGGWRETVPWGTVGSAATASLEDLSVAFQGCINPSARENEPAVAPWRGGTVFGPEIRRRSCGRD